MSEKTNKKILQLCAVDMSIKNLLLPLIDGLIHAGYDVVSCASYGKYTDELRVQGYKIENIEIARKISLASNIKSLFLLYRFIKREKFDIVHVHTPIAALLGRVAAKLAGIPLVIYTAHGFYFHDRMSSWVFKAVALIEKLAGRLFTDYIFTQSEEDRLTAIKLGIIRKDRIEMIGNGVDVNGTFNPDAIDQETILRKRRELGLSENDRVISFIGRLVKEKGIVELLQAFEDINASDGKLILIGSNEASERDMVTYSYIKQSAESNKNILMLGNRSDIAELLYLSDIFVLPSYREGMPRSIIEAMAMEKPVIATDIRGCREEVIDQVTGYLVPVGNAQAISDRLKYLIENPEIAKSMGKKARERALNLFDENKIIKKQIEVLNRLQRR